MSQAFGGTTHKDINGYDVDETDNGFSIRDGSDGRLLHVVDRSSQVPNAVEAVRLYDTGAFSDLSV